MHIRPYVDLPDDGVPDGPAGEDRPQPDLAPFARCGTDETSELPVVQPPLRPAEPAPEATGQGDGRHRAGAAPRRRRPGNALLAAVGVAAALGTGLLSSQLLFDKDDGSDSHSLSAEDTEPDLGPTNAPAHESPSPERTVAQRAPSSASPSAPSRAQTSAPQRADRDSRVHTESPVPEPSRSAPRTDGDGRDGQWHDGPRDRDRDESAGPGDGGAEASAEDGTLRVGDSGPEVRELQLRLKQAGYLDDSAEEDGQYSTAVQQSVFRYQAEHRIEDDVRGEYGPQTRSSLESRTSG